MPQPLIQASIQASIQSAAPARLPLAFLVGQSAEGHWLAVETHGLGGGIFRSRRDALHYAAAETGRRPDAVRLSSTPIALVP